MADADLTALLVSARRDAKAIDRLDAGLVPADLDAAYEVQHAAATRLGTIAGWKIAAVTAEQRRALGVERPIAAPLLEPWLQRLDSGGTARWPWRTFIGPILECEFAFRLARDLPPRDDRDWTRDEVADAVEGLAIAIEIVDPRTPPGTPVTAALADAFNNGAFAHGPVLRDWRSLDLATQTIVLRDAGGGEVARGDGRAILGGDPFGTVVLLANAQRGWPRGLEAGDVVTTGSCTGAPRAAGPGRWSADFGSLGTISLELT